MMPLTLTDVGQEQIVRRIGGNDEVRRHLENLGFVAGSAVTLISALGGNVIVKVKESRVAISAEMARKIMVLMDNKKDSFCRLRAVIFAKFPLSKSVQGGEE